MKFDSKEEISLGETAFVKPLDLFKERDTVKMCAPMVRYSKLAFRNLVRKYGCDLAFTPMIISESFVRSLKARDSDFSTNCSDRPLIVQFAASNSKDFADAAEIVKPFSDGVDLNCGCPQRWAMQEGYGSCLLRKPQLIADMVKHMKDRVRDSSYTVSIKIRVHKNIRETVELCRQAEHIGVSWISVHGRTPQQRTQPVDLEAIRVIKDSVSVPVVANGDIKSLKDVVMVKQCTGVDGVMAARGILSNPAMYDGYENTPKQCMQDWVDLALESGTPFSTFHHHLIYMQENTSSKADKRLFNGLSSTSAVLNFLSQHYNIGYPHQHQLVCSK